MKFLFVSLSILMALALPHPGSAAETRDIDYPFKNADKVIFSHAFHLKLPAVNGICKTCHNAIFDLQNKRRFTMQMMEQGKGCGACHNGTKGFSVFDEKLCARCHTGKPRDLAFKAKGINNATFSHTLHLARIGGRCKTCHNGKTIITGQNNITMAQMEQGKRCGACHNGKAFTLVAANCTRCHVGFTPGTMTFTLPAGAAVAPAIFSHEFHLGIYKCADCHIKLFPYRRGIKHYSMQEIRDGKSCGTCHGTGKDAFVTNGNCTKCHQLPPAEAPKPSGA